jgi:hypothetical protein
LSGCTTGSFSGRAHLHEWVSDSKNNTTQKYITLTTRYQIARTALCTKWYCYLEEMFSVKIYWLSVLSTSTTKCLLLVTTSLPSPGTRTRNASNRVCRGDSRWWCPVAGDATVLTIVSRAAPVVMLQHMWKAACYIKSVRLHIHVPSNVQKFISYKLPVLHRGYFTDYCLMDCDTVSSCRWIYVSEQYAASIFRVLTRLEPQFLCFLFLYHHVSTLVLPFHPEDGGSRFLRNADNDLPDYISEDSSLHHVRYLVLGWGHWIFQLT